MKEYKVMETSKKKAEQLMNEMAKQGWEVVSVTYWNNFKTVEGLQGKLLEEMFGENGWV